MAKKDLLCWLPCQRSDEGPCGICACCRSPRQTPCWCTGWCKPSGTSCTCHSGCTLWLHSGSYSLWWMQVQLKGSKKMGLCWQNLHRWGGCRVVSKNKHVKIVAHLRWMSVAFSLTEQIPLKISASHKRSVFTPSQDAFLFPPTF